MTAPRLVGGGRTRSDLDGLSQRACCGAVRTLRVLAVLLGDERAFQVGLELAPLVSLHPIATVSHAERRQLSLALCHSVMTPPNVRVSKRQVANDERARNGGRMQET